MGPGTHDLDSVGFHLVGGDIRGIPPFSTITSFLHLVSCLISSQEERGGVVSQEDEQVLWQVGGRGGAVQEPGGFL